MGRSPAETELQACRPGLPLSRILRKLVLPALARGRRSGNSHCPLCHLQWRLVLTVEVFQRIAPWLVPPLDQPISHRPLEAVDLSFDSGALVTCHCILNRFFRRKRSDLQRTIYCIEVKDFWRHLLTPQHTRGADGSLTQS
jgi:hypothetical protein